MSKASFLLTGNDDDYYQAKKTIERRDKKKLFDNITSILHRLELDRVKPSFEVQAQTGFRRSSLRNRKRLSRASYDRSPSEDRSAFNDSAPVNRSRNRNSKCEPQSRPESLYIRAEPQNHPRPASVFIRAEPQNHPRPASVFFSADEPTRHNQETSEQKTYKSVDNDPYGAQSALRQMKKDFLGTNQGWKEDVSNKFVGESRRGGSVYPSYSETIGYPSYSARVKTPEPDRGENLLYWKNSYASPVQTSYKSYYPEFDRPRQDLISYYRGIRETRPVAASYERTAGLKHDNDWTRTRPQSTPPNFYQRNAYSPAAEYRNYGLGIVGRKVAESHMDLDYLDRLIDRTFGAKSRSYLPPPESYYVNNYNASPSLSYYLPGSNSYYTPYVPYVHTPPIVRSFVASQPIVRHVVQSYPTVRSTSAFTYMEEPKVETINRRHSVLISPPTRITRPSIFRESATRETTSKSETSNLRPSIRKTRPMSFAAGSNLDFYREKLRN